MVVHKYVIGDITGCSVKNIEVEIISSCIDKMKYPKNHIPTIFRVILKIS
jgi:hypothetical protein